MRTTLLGVLNTARAALPHLDHEGGTLIVVGSIAGRVPVPWLAAYAAAKHGVRGFARALDAELRALGSPVRVALVAPGPVDTPFWERARTTDQRLPRGHLPRRTPADLERFRYDNSTVKVDWRCAGRFRGPTRRCARRGPCTSPRAWTCLTEVIVGLELQRIPARRSFSASPRGGASAHPRAAVPRAGAVRHGGPDSRAAARGRWDTDELERFVARMEDEIECLAPGFRDRVLGRRIAARTSSSALTRTCGRRDQRRNREGPQQLVFHPLPGLGRPETPVRGLYLGSASVHPGGGVHGRRARTGTRAAGGRRLAPAAIVQRLRR